MRSPYSWSDRHSTCEWAPLTNSPFELARLFPINCYAQSLSSIIRIMQSHVETFPSMPRPAVHRLEDHGFAWEKPLVPGTTVGRCTPHGRRKARPGTTRRTSCPDPDTGARSRFPGQNRSIDTAGEALVTEVSIPTHGSRR